MYSLKFRTFGLLGAWPGQKGLMMISTVLTMKRPPVQFPRFHISFRTCSARLRQLVVWETWGEMYDIK